MTPAGDRGALRRFSSALVALFLVTGSESRAAAPGVATHTRQLEYRLGLAGGTENLRLALDLGASLDRRSPRWVLGMGLGLLRGKTPAPDQDVWGLVWDVHARHVFLPLRIGPYVETGVGFYMFDVEPASHREAERSFVSPGLFVGTGLDLRLSPENSVRLGASLHLTKIDRDSRGHYQAGLAFAFHPPAR